MKAFQGVTRTAFLGFFSSHIVFTVIVDLQALLPATLVPTPLRNLLAWYTATLKDPLMSDPPLWFQSLICFELVIQLPFFCTACYYLTKYRVLYPDKFRIACIAYSAHACTSMGPILASLATATALSTVERAVLVNLYLPYLIFPAWLLLASVFSSVPTERPKIY
jgi:hypothetical protein|uniref:EXPERA domain-containing protein n=1 Tax=Phaeodactylum tricornutum TaxID=2850 RepID=A0A8J9X1C5_PHATR